MAPRVFVSSDSISGDKIRISGEDVKHITKVLRLTINDKIVVCDGLGKDYQVVITDIDNKSIETKVIDVSESKGEPPVNITLYQGLPKSDKLEYIIQKAVEMGVYEVVPVITKRTVVKIKDYKSEKNKLSRWQRIAYEAAKQSMRGRIPKVSAPVHLEEAIEQMKKADLRIFAYEQEKCNKLKNMLEIGEKIRNIGILIGPEGGFEEEEVIKCKLANLIPATLGPRILRTETAGLFILSILIYKFGNI